MPAANAVSPEAYEHHKATEAARNRARSLAGRDIGELPEIEDHERREGCRLDFKLFCETYHAERFYWGWSADHLLAIERIEQCVLKGGQFALAMARASGKTQLITAAGEWADLYAHRHYVMILGADDKAARKLLRSIRMDYEHNPLLLADFPEVCFPFKAIDGVRQRASGQLYLGEPTEIEITNERIVIPTIPNSPASGSVIEVAGLQSGIRGRFMNRKDGTVIRPDLLLIDDPQTKQSAKSPQQVSDREETIHADCMGLAGPGKTIAALAAVTVIKTDDLADRLLDRKLHPYWRGQRTQLMRSMPKNEELWEQYRLIHERCSETGEMADANAFYAENREAMDEGADPSWPERYDRENGELSATQHAMNLKFRVGPEAFASEYQNQPLTDELEDDLPTREQVLEKCLPTYVRRIVPEWATMLTAGVDIQSDLLFWTVVAWNQQFTGHVVDYGVFPPTKRRQFTRRDLRSTLSRVYAKEHGTTPGREALWYWGLSRLASEVLFNRDKPWRIHGGGEMQIEQLVIDAAYGFSSSTVRKWAAEGGHAGITLPAFGKRYKGKPIEDAKKKPGERVGRGYRITRNQRGTGRFVLFDADFYKTLVMRRFGTAHGAPGSLTLFGDRTSHGLLIDHVFAETRTVYQGPDRSHDEWNLLPSRPDNDWKDTMSHCAVGAAVRGAKLEGEAPKRRRKRTVSLAEMQRRKRAAG
ncbi:MAG: terminase gpA endonuclease subunit [Planctomycetota bacterium]